MKTTLNLGKHNSRWTAAQDDRLIHIVDTELGHNLHDLDDKALEGVLDEIGQRYTVEGGNERNRNGLRLRLKKLREEIHIHVFLEYERFRKDGHKPSWKGDKSNSFDKYTPDEIKTIDERKRKNNLPVTIFISNKKDKADQKDFLIAGPYIGLDWIIEGETAYYVRPKFEDADYAQMFVDVFSLDRNDSFSEYRILVNERSKTYQFDPKRQRIPLSKKKDNLSVQIFTTLLLVHLIEMTWIMAHDSRFKTPTKPWNDMRERVRRARESSLITKQAEQIISSFLEQKEKETSEDALTSKANVHDVYGNNQTESLDSLVRILDGILLSAENVDSPDLRIPPFRIDMPRLFELYIYWLLSKMDNGRVKPLIRYQTEFYLSASDDLSDSLKKRTDFLIEGKGLLIDAKYKEDYNKESYYSDNDLRQLIYYTRLGEVARICNAKGDIKAIIAFPSNKDVTDTTHLDDMSNTARSEVKKNRDVIELYKCAFPLPKIV